VDDANRNYGNQKDDTNQKHLQRGGKFTKLFLKGDNIRDVFKVTGFFATNENNRFVIDVSGSEKEGNGTVNISEGVEDFRFFVQDENFNHTGL